jgi:hypothetical protein
VQPLTLSGGMSLLEGEMTEMDWEYLTGIILVIGTFLLLWKD